MKNDTAQANDQQVQVSQSIEPAVVAQSAKVSAPSGGQSFQPTPISIGQKEQAGRLLADVKTEALISASEAEEALSSEVSEAGVEKVTEVAPLPKDAEKVGIKLAKEATPVATQPSGMIQLPMSEEEARSVLGKNKNIASSAVWRAMLVLRQVRKHLLLMHKKLKGGL